ncbi:hypothetical protein [Sodalinema gerasimenkoae]|uniref:hypothetical protein n=1 Tax=Sodalinema gerasimenkoae TaxID=2862348 RepID=UPI001358E6B2|nr:hypothetical protein [Sodalinema gerasimenkoae]
MFLLSLTQSSASSASSANFDKPSPLNLASAMRSPRERFVWPIGRKIESDGLTSQGEI